jgi:hypothetical protein
MQCLPGISATQFSQNNKKRKLKKQKQEQGMKKQQAALRKDKLALSLSLPFH